MKKFGIILLFFFLISCSDINFEEYNFVNNPSILVNEYVIFDSLQVHFIDVGQGDSTLFKVGSIEIIIDCGDNEYGDNIVSYLNSLNVQDIDLLITTHPHADHIGGCDDIMKSFNVKEVWDNGKSHDSVTYRDYLSYAEKTTYKTATTGMTSNIGNLSIVVVHADMGSSNVNDNSVVTKISYGDVDFLITGDCENECEDSITSDIASEFLKVGHHGSSTSSGDVFLEKVNPQISIISVGTKNKYNHPSNITLFKLKGTELYRTDFNGDIIITTNGHIYQKI